MTLSPELLALIANKHGKPCCMVELHFPDSYVLRVADHALTFGGHAYAADISGDVSWQQSLDPKFDDCQFKLINIERTYTDLFASYTPPELLQTDVIIYESFRGAATREERFRGKLEIPSGFNRGEVTIKARHLLNSLLEQFCHLANQPQCAWATQCRFAAGDRCTYAPPATGSAETLSSGVDADDTEFHCANPDLYYEGDYVQVESEVVYVEAVASDHLVVTRGQAGTTAVPHLAGKLLLHASCDGNFESCDRRGMLHRFGGLKFFNKSGTLIWKEKLFLWFSRKVVQPWESQSNKGIFGSAWGVLYGTCKINLEPLYVRDPGAFAVYFASVGAGPIEGPQAVTEGHRPALLVNGNESFDFGFYRGNDGSAVVNYYGSDSDAEGQGIEYLWIRDPNTGTGYSSWSAARLLGQTFSRRAYVAGAFPSTAQNQEGLPTVEGIFKGRRLNRYDVAGGIVDCVYTASPAWVLIDAAINADYGSGIPASMIDWASMYAADAAFASLGFTFNSFIKAPLPFPDFVSMLCHSTLSFPTFNANKLGLLVLQPGMAHSGVTLTRSDIFEGGYSHWEDGPVERDANTLKVDLVSSDYDYQAVPVTFSDEDHIAAMGGRKRDLNLKLTGIDNLDQIKRIGAFWLNMAKAARRPDGVRKLKCSYVAMQLSPGSIITIDTDEEDGLGGSLDYMVWSLKRLNADGDYELTCVLWDDDLFTVSGIGYESPTTGINPSLPPVWVENLAVTAEEIDDQVRLAITWDWTDPVPPSPAPAKVFLFLGDPEFVPEHYELITPKGIGREVSSFQHFMPKHKYAKVQVVAVGQSAFRVPQTPRVECQVNPDAWTRLDGAITYAQDTYDVDDASAFSAGDFLILPWGGDKAEIHQVLGIVGNTIQTEVDLDGDRESYYGTAAVEFPDNQAVHLMTLNGPSAEQVIYGPVQPIPYVYGYDKASDATLQTNQIRLKIGRSNSGTPAKYIHVQLNATLPFTDPTESPSGSGTCCITQPLPSFVLLVPGSGVDASHVGKLFVIKEVADRCGRYITAVDTGYSYGGRTWIRVDLAGYIPRWQGWHDWAVWDLWYNLHDYAFNVPVDANVTDLQANEYNIVLTVDEDWTGYARVYLTNDGSLSDPEIATDALGVTVELGTSPTVPLDDDVPGVPTDIKAYLDGRKAITSWGLPASNTNTLQGYYVFLVPEPGEITGTPGNWNISGSYQVYSFPAYTYRAEIVLDRLGRWDVGVKAKNDLGESELGAWYKD